MLLNVYWCLIIFLLLYLDAEYVFFSIVSNLCRVLRSFCNTMLIKRKRILIFNGQNYLHSYMFETNIEWSEAFSSLFILILYIRLIFCLFNIQSDNCRRTRVSIKKRQLLEAWDSLTDRIPGFVDLYFWNVHCRIHADIATKYSLDTASCIEKFA